MGADKYEDIYSQYIGFMFERSASGKLVNLEYLSAAEVSDISIGFGNEDNIYICCKPCGTFMNFRYGPKEFMDGKWVCPECGCSVREVTPYKILDKMNLAFQNSIDTDDDYDDYYG